MHCPELMVVYAGVWVWMRSLISLELTPDYSCKITTSQWPKTAAIQQRSEMRVLFTHAQWGLISPEWGEGSLRGELALTDLESTGKTLWFYCLICFTISSCNWADNRCTFISFGLLSNTMLILFVSEELEIKLGMNLFHWGKSRSLRLTHSNSLWYL